MNVRCISPRNSPKSHLKNQTTRQVVVYACWFACEECGCTVVSTVIAAYRIMTILRLHRVPKKEATFIFFEYLREMLADFNNFWNANDYNFTHLTIILLLHYLVKCRSRSLAVCNNEFILGSACVGSEKN